MKCFIILLALKVWFVKSDWVKLPTIADKDTFLAEDSQLVNQKHFNDQSLIQFNVDSFIENTNVSLQRAGGVANDFVSELTTKANPFAHVYPDRLSNKKISDSSKKLSRLNSNTERNNLITIKNNETSAQIITKESDDIFLNADYSSTSPDAQNTQKSKAGPFNLNHLANILKNIQANIFSNIPHAIKNKKDYLKDIRDRILLNIEDRIGLIWPNNDNRQARGHKGDDQHLDFPSAETALMTIGFLTFAVFLIKLVLQVINVLKAKKMMYFTPMTTAMGRSHQDNQQTDIETTARILQMMEDFKKY